MSDVFNLAVRTYYEDTDSAGVVYYANYLKFMERARTEFLRSLGYELTTLDEQYQVVFVVRSVAIEYLKPAHLNDLLIVSVLPIEFGRSRMVFEQQVHRKSTGELIVEAKVNLVCIHSKELKPISIPKEVKEALISKSCNLDI